MNYQRIIDKLRDTHVIIVRASHRLVERGVNVTEAETKSREVLETSELFMFRTIPWYERLYRQSKKLLFCPGWWFRCCCPRKDEPIPV